MKLGLHKKKDLVLALAGLLILSCALVIVFALYRSNQFDKWIREDLDTLSPYETTLVPSGQDTDNILSERDRSMKEYLSDGRLVVEMSRSGYFHSISGKESWAKVYLKTTKPTPPRSDIPIKLLVHLKEENSTWQVVEVNELVLP